MQKMMIDVVRNICTENVVRWLFCDVVAAKWCLTHPQSDLLECIVSGEWWPNRQTKLNNLLDRRFACVGSFIKKLSFLTENNDAIDTTFSNRNATQNRRWNQSMLWFTDDTSCTKWIFFSCDIAHWITLMMRRHTNSLATIAKFVWLHSNDNITYIYSNQNITHEHVYRIQESRYSSRNIT